MNDNSEVLGAIALEIQKLNMTMQSNQRSIENLFERLLVQMEENCPTSESKSPQDS
ncbi:MAG: hypothetical protein K0U66_06465 [Gammaproteobacteria bacterium]|nr:hypothetical protein [Gammaproteobacteria bacterium]